MSKCSNKIKADRKCKRFLFVTHAHAPTDAASDDGDTFDRSFYWPFQSTWPADIVTFASDLMYRWPD